MKFLVLETLNSRKKSNEKIKSMMEEGVSVLLVTHSLKQIKEICDRCIWIENGKLLMEGETKKVVKAYKKNANKDKKKSKKKKKSKDKKSDDEKN